MTGPLHWLSQLASDDEVQPAHHAPAQGRHRRRRVRHRRRGGGACRTLSIARASGSPRGVGPTGRGPGAPQRLGQRNGQLSFSGATVRLVADAPGVARTERARPPRRNCSWSSTSRCARADRPPTCRCGGVQTAAFQVRDNVRLVQGRRFEPGRNEVIVGRGAARHSRASIWAPISKWAGMNGGSSAIFARTAGSPNRRSGRTPGCSKGPTTAATAFSRCSRGSPHPNAFETFQHALSRDPRLNVKVIRQTDYYWEQSRVVYNLITGLGTIIAG